MTSSYLGFYSIATQFKFTSAMLLWIHVKEMNKNECQSFNLDLYFCLFGLDTGHVILLDMGHMILLVSFQTVYLWTSSPASSISGFLVILCCLFHPVAIFRALFYNAHSSLNSIFQRHYQLHSFYFSSLSSSMQVTEIFLCPSLMETEFFTVK